MSTAEGASFELDRPEVVAEVRAAFAAYEAALVARDLDRLGASFLAADQVVRFGISDRQQGAAELAAWRAAQGPLPPGRRLSETVVTSFGRDVAVVTTCFAYPGRPFLGRQSQTWLRLEGRWQIVTAHVSEIPAPDA